MEFLKNLLDCLDEGQRKLLAGVRSRIDDAVQSSNGTGVEEDGDTPPVRMI